MKAIYLFLVVAVLLVSCKSSYKERGAQDSAEISQRDKLLKASAEQTPRIPASSCRLIATILSIDESRSDNTEDVCSKAPCRAIVRVDSVLGFGQASSYALARGNEIEITFKFSLYPTDDLFPNMTQSYPGLAVGDAFLADVEASRTGMSPKEKPIFMVYGYKKQSN